MVRCLDLLSDEVLLDLPVRVGGILEVALDVEDALAGKAPAFRMVLRGSGLLPIPRDFVVIGSLLDPCDLLGLLLGGAVAGVAFGVPSPTTPLTGVIATLPVVRCMLAPSARSMANRATTRSQPVPVPAHERSA